MGKLRIIPLAVSLCVTWSFFLLCIGWAAWLLDWGGELVKVVGSLYIGFEPTLLGGIIGALWGLADGAVAGIIIALIYNLMVKS